MSARTRCLKRVTVALGTLALTAAASSILRAQEPTPEPLKPWTLGTTEAANEVVGARSGLGFAFVPAVQQPPPDPERPELTISAAAVDGLVQVLDLSASPPPDGDMPSIRIRLLPPGPTTPARLELHVLDPTAISIFGPNGQPATLCSQ